MLTYTPEKKIKLTHLSVPEYKEKYFTLPNLPVSPRLLISLQGGFLDEKFSNRTEKFVSVYLRTRNNASYWSSIDSGKNLSEMWNIPVYDPKFFDTGSASKQTHLFNVG